MGSTSASLRAEKSFFGILRQKQSELRNAALSDNDVERIATPQSYGILATLPEQEDQDTVDLMSAMCGVPITVMSLVDEDRQ